MASGHTTPYPPHHSQPLMRKPHTQNTTSRQQGSNVTTQRYLLDTALDYVIYFHLVFV